MQEDITRGVINLAEKTEQLTEQALKEAISRLLQNRKENKNSPQVGRNTLEKITARDGGANMIEVQSKLPQFERIARKYHVKYHVRKDPTSQPVRWQFFFQGKQADQVTAALKEYAGTLTRQTARPSLLHKLQKNIQKVRSLPQAPERDQYRGGAR